MLSVNQIREELARLLTQANKERNKINQIERIATANLSDWDNCLEKTSSQVRDIKSYLRTITDCITSTNHIFTELNQLQEKIDDLSYWQANNQATLLVLWKSYVEMLDVLKGELLRLSETIISAWQFADESNLAEESQEELEKYNQFLLEQTEKLRIAADLEMPFFTPSTIPLEILVDEEEFELIEGKEKVRSKLDSNQKVPKKQKQ